MRSVNLFREPVYVEDVHRVQVGFWKTMCFGVSLLSALVAYGFVILSQQRTVSGTLYFSSDASAEARAAAESASAAEEHIHCPAHLTSYECYRQYILGLDGSPDIAPKLGTTCRCASSEPVRLGKAVSLHLPRAADPKYNVFRTLFGLTAPGQAFGAEAVNGSNPFEDACELAHTAHLLPHSEPLVRQCLSTLAAVLAKYAQTLFFQWAAVQPRIQSASLGLSLLTVEQFDAAAATAVQDAVIGFMLQSNTFQQTLGLSTSLNNPIPIPYGDEWITAAVDVCFVPGTANPPGCNCNSTLTRGNCTFEARFDPFHLHNELFPGQPLPAGLPSQPFRVLCPDQQQFVRSLPQYMFKYGPLYGPRGLGCPLQQSLYQGFVELNSSVAQQFGLPLRSGVSTVGDSAALPTSPLGGPIVSNLDFFSDDGSNAIKINPDFFKTDYSRYFEKCAPASCTYLVRRQPTVLTAALLALSVLGSFQVLVSTCVNQVGTQLDTWLSKDDNKEKVSNVISSLERAPSALRSRLSTKRTQVELAEEAALGPQIISHRSTLSTEAEPTDHQSSR